MDSPQRQHEFLLTPNANSAHASLNILSFKYTSIRASL